LSSAANRTAVTAGDGENPFPKNARDRVADPGGIAIIRNLPRQGAWAPSNIPTSIIENNGSVQRSDELYSAIWRACHQSAKEDRAEEYESRDFRIESPAAIPMSERLLIAVGNSKAAIRLSANLRPCPSLSSIAHEKAGA
jgi:hypothetical protein